ncbi:zinc-dependent alcohol dehydrogenase [Sphingomonas sp. NPDC079357]|uniref:zinc-dependent alcohol dehydrogenase n=1 Tax=Sphingomonas sp. NPDC079357 TaxID=3364518 RepID=UPI00384FD016
MSTMRAAVVRRFGEPIVIEEWPIPVPGQGEVLVKVAASGVCHTDLHAADGDWPIRPSLPLVLGHEGIGHVCAMGPGVADLREGDLVGVPWLHDACGACEWCLRGWETLCERQHNTGYGVHGTHADYVIARAAFAGRVPATDDLAALAPVLCAGVTTYKGLIETGARPGEWVVISGVGGLGHVGVQYARAMGFRPIGLDTNADKRALALACGAEAAVDAAATDAVDQIVAITGGGAHGVLVTAASLPAFRTAIGAVRRGGTVALVGLPPGDMPLPIFDVVLKRITVRGSIVGTRADLEEALGFAARGLVKPRVTTFPLDEANGVFEQLRAETVDGRAVLVP